MIRIDTHGRRWIMEQVGMKNNSCPECFVSPYLVHEGKPEENGTEYWFDCECKRCGCGCEWTVKYEAEIEYID
jgi:hypothetical protein